MTCKAMGCKGNWKKYLCAAFWLLIILLIYGMIFFFSGQEGEDSGSLSYQVSKQCVELLDKVSPNDWSEALKAELAGNMEHPIRKLAHFSEYALLAIAIYFFLAHLQPAPWKPITKKMFLGILGLIILSAAADEIHQFFVPERNCSLLDVFIDTCGGAFGLCVCVGLGKIRERRLERKQRK